MVPKAFEKVSKRKYSNYIFFYRSAFWNTLKQGMYYLLNFFGSTRKVFNVTFSLGEKYYLLDEIKEYFVEGNCDAFDDSIADMLSSLATQYESYKEKARNGEIGKIPQYWLIYLEFIYLQTMTHSAV